MTGIFEQQVAVRWRDTDALGHVNHAVFLTYFEVGRDAFFGQVLGSEPIYVIARLEIDFRAEVRPAEKQVRVQIAVERLGTTSLTTRETLSLATGEVAAQAKVVSVRWDEELRKPIPFTASDRERLTAYLLTPGT